MMIILIIVGWVVCGILAQGMCRYNFAQKVSPKKVYGPSILLLSILMVSGPFGILSEISICILYRTWGLKFKYDE